MSNVEESLKLDPNEVTAIHHRAVVLLALNRLPEARQAFEAALKRSPAEAVIWNDYGAALEAMGQTNDALGAYRRAMKIEPPSKNAFLATALLEIHLGHFNEATGALDLLAKDDPKPNALALALRSVIARRGGNVQQAEQLEEQASHLDAAATAWALAHAAKANP